MRVAVLRVGKASPTWADAAAADYGQRLVRWVRFDDEVVKPVPFRGDVDAVRHGEGERVLARVGPRDRLVVVDERGEGLDSHAFAGLIDRCRTTGTHRLVFALGGAYGHAPAVRDAAWRTVRLAPFVLNHEVARVVLVEQIYRAFTLLHSVPYHH